MRLQLLALVLLFSNFLLTAQPHSPRTYVMVTDFGQLYSTYDWEKGGADLINRLGKNLADEVIAGSVESAWPEGIKYFMSRVENKAMMSLYRVYFLTTIEGGIAILVASPADNQHMPANMQSDKNMYFVIGRSGVDLSEVMPSSQTQTKPQIVAGFTSQLSEITEDFSNMFANTISSILEEDEDGMVITYSSLKNLEGSTNAYLLVDLYAASTMYHADFPASADFAVATQNYLKLIRQVEASKLSCCVLKKKDEHVDGKIRIQNFMVADAEFSFVNMIIGIYLEQGETFDNKGFLVSNWRPVLEIYEK